MVFAEGPDRPTFRRDAALRDARAASSRPGSVDATRRRGCSTSEVLRMADLSDKQRDRLDDDQFAYVDRDGDRKLPINDETHVRNAIARFGQTDFDDAGEKPRAAKRILDAAKRDGIEVGEDDDVRRAAKG